MEIPNFESRHNKVDNQIHSGNISFVTEVAGQGSSNTD